MKLAPSCFAFLALTLAACSLLDTPMQEPTPPIEEPAPVMETPPTMMEMPTMPEMPVGPINPVEPDPNDPSLEWGPTIEVTGECNPPALLRLEDIPDDPSLDDGDEDTVAIFEVDGHKLVGKHVDDAAAGEGALKLWQELTLRFPENQLRDLVQFEVYTSTGQSGYFNRTNKVTTKREGIKLGFSTENFQTNDPDPCAPLVPRRGNYDWTLVHEMGHVRGWVDGSWTRYMLEFGNKGGAGEGYPEDGSPQLTGEFPTSYAERADADEDYAEVWTTFVMLPLSVIPEPKEGEPLVITKLRWMANQPGLKALRQAIRVTEPDGGNVTVTAAPRLDYDKLWADYEAAIEMFPFENPNRPPEPEYRESAVVDNRDWLLGTWSGTFVKDGQGFEQEYTFTADNTLEVHRDGDGVELYRRDYKALMEAGELKLTYVDYAEDALYGWQMSLGELGFSEDFVQGDGTYLLWTSSFFEHNDVPLMRVENP